MICKEWKVSENSEAILKTYILDDEEYARKGIIKPAVIVCPGGGYTEVSRNEGEPVALAFAAQGYHAFVLNYSVKIENPFPKALTELALAVKLVREHAKEWRIDTDRISVAGFSAGGHLAAGLGVYYHTEYLQNLINCTEEEIKPNSLILGYPAFSLEPVSESNEIPQYLIDLMDQGLMMDFRGPGIRQIMTGKMEFTQEDMEPINLLKHVSPKMPPVFMFGSYSDRIIPVSDLLTMASLCKENGVLCELHLFANGPHGQGLYQPHCIDENMLKNQHMN
ncbi:MAG: alpha/beta hydrolase, partial [Acetatifactor sp.]|nr:alpha/beta hydrolase [Acetatifactor sp.]